MIVRKYVAHSTEGRLMPQNFGYIDVNCFGDQLLSTLRLDRKKDLPRLIVFRKSLDGSPSEGIYALDEAKFNGYSAARFLNKLVTRERSLA